MATTINKTKEVIDRLKAEQKILTLNSPGDLAKIAATNKHMEEVRREFQVKERESQMSASKVILTA
ncbi:MAG: hypothetical protein KF860_14840 [Cyclobacteriaceae bacterium]|nr:hypothetical protein [Cyclobacteriaceae bacterium]